jgi:hypothetical protein
VFGDRDGGLAIAYARLLGLLARAAARADGRGPGSEDNSPIEASSAGESASSCAGVGTCWIEGLLGRRFEGTGDPSLAIEACLLWEAVECTVEPAAEEMPGLLLVLISRGALDIMVRNGPSRYAIVYRAQSPKKRSIASGSIAGLYRNDF